MFFLLLGPTAELPSGEYTISSLVPGTEFTNLWHYSISNWLGRGNQSWKWQCQRWTSVQISLPQSLTWRLVEKKTISRQERLWNEILSFFFASGAQTTRPFIGCLPVRFLLCLFSILSLFLIILNRRKTEGRNRQRKKQPMVLGPGGCHFLFIGNMNEITFRQTEGIEDEESSPISFSLLETTLFLARSRSHGHMLAIFTSRLLFRGTRMETDKCVPARVTHGNEITRIQTVGILCSYFQRKYYPPSWWFIPVGADVNSFEKRTQWSADVCSSFLVKRNVTGT
jgi:hypothetical protein